MGVTKHLLTGMVLQVAPQKSGGWETTFFFGFRFIFLTGFMAVIFRMPAITGPYFGHPKLSIIGFRNLWTLEKLILRKKNGTTRTCLEIRIEVNDGEGGWWLMSPCQNHIWSNFIATSHERFPPKWWFSKGTPRLFQGNLPTPSNGCQLDPKGWWIDTLWEAFSTLWKVQVGWWNIIIGPDPMPQGPPWQEMLARLQVCRAPKVGNPSKPEVCQFPFWGFMMVFYVFFLVLNVIQPTHPQKSPQVLLFRCFFFEKNSDFLPAMYVYPEVKRNQTTKLCETKIAPPSYRGRSTMRNEVDSAKF